LISLTTTVTIKSDSGEEGSKVGLIWRGGHSLEEAAGLREKVELKSHIEAQAWPTGRPCRVDGLEPIGNNADLQLHGRD